MASHYLCTTDFTGNFLMDRHSEHRHHDGYHAHEFDQDVQ